MHFQIFVPQKSDVAGTLIDVGLAHLAQDFDAKSSTGPATEAGHVDAGAVFAWRTPGAHRWGFEPDEQTWIAAAADPERDLPAGRYYVGCWNASPPTPRDLSRRYQERGDFLKLGDGHDWLVPVAADLPRDLLLQDDGSLKFELQRQFYDYGVAVDAWSRRVEHLNSESTDGNPVSFEETFRFALQALSINYRITPEVAAHLRLFSDRTVHRPLFVAIGAYRAAAAGGRA